MYEKTLEQLELSAEQIAIYETLLKLGTLTAGRLAKELPYKRSALYYHLDRLIELQIIEKDTSSGKITKFKPLHPVKLVDLAETKIRRAKDAQRSIESIIPSLITEFNTISGEPGIQYYEGDEGVEKVIFNTLNAKEKILQYVDIEAVLKFIPKIQEKYAKKRKQLEKQKKIIVTGSDFNKKFFLKEGDNLLDTRYISYNMEDFGSIMYIYDDVIAYITLDEHKKKGIVINDPHLAKMHKQLFNYTWSTTKVSI